MPLDETSTPDGPSPALARATYRLDRLAAPFAGAVFAVLHMAPAIAKRHYDASDLQIGLIVSAQAAGLLFSPYMAHQVVSRPAMPLVFWPEILARLALIAVVFLAPGQVLGFVALMMLARAITPVSGPARLLIYRRNYPDERRGRIVGRIRGVQFLGTTVFAVLLAAALDLEVEGSLVRRLLSWLLPAGSVERVSGTLVIHHAIPAIGVLGCIGSIIFRRIRVRTGAGPPGGTGEFRNTLRRVWRVVRRDREYRNYQLAFMGLGVGNLMALPIIPIYAVERFQADYTALALILVVIEQTFMFISLPWWGRRFDHGNPSRLRGILNCMMIVDLLVLALAPRIEFIYAGRVFRGLAMAGGQLVWMLGPLYFARSSAEAPIYVGIHMFNTGVRWLAAPVLGVGLKALAGGDARAVFWVSLALVALSGSALLRQGGRLSNRVRAPEPSRTPAAEPGSEALHLDGRPAIS